MTMTLVRTLISYISLDMQQKAEPNQDNGHAAPTVKQVCTFCESHPGLVGLLLPRSLHAGMA